MAPAVDTASVPAVQRAAVVKEAGAPPTVVNDYPVKQPAQLAPGECLVHIEASGVCHTDLHAAKGDWPVKASYPLVGGHEGVGQVVAIGAGTPNSPVKIGDRVGVKWIAESCLNCEQCKRGNEQTCYSAKLSGYTVDGTFCEYLLSSVYCVSKIPGTLDSHDAASILCAGVTMYRAIKYSETQASDWMVIPGAGGGLGHMGVQYAKVRGLRVVAIDTGADKKALCEKLGADAWIDFKETKDVVAAVKAVTDGLGAHSAVVASASPASYTQATEYLRPGGTLMVVGLPGAATLDASIFFTVLRSIKILGSYVGNRQDADEALAIAASGKVKVIYSKQPLSALAKVYDEMEAGKIAGRIVLDLNA
ncbi:mannitol-1-phosphate dehydrogenase [Hyaloraphidium curvatum]|nr:mannitol-1-phosphate dehydrogenase [Hyaloraphidium curvatum]